MNAYFALIFGVISAGLGGELFVRGTVGLGHWLRISPGIIGATLAAFATSSPEFSVSIQSALRGDPQIALGDALGSNIINIALILGLALIMSGLQTPRDTLKRDFPVALLVPVIMGVLFLDGILSRFDGMLMLAIFAFWMIATLIEVRKQRNAAEEVLGEHHRGLIILSCIFGLGLLILAGHWIVTGAKEMAKMWGTDEFMIGSLLVALGTSMPELATTIIAKLKKHDEVGLGAILGSNIFNGFCIAPVAAILHPITVVWREVVVALLFGLITLILIYPDASGYIEKRRGVLLLVIYGVYLALMLHQ